MSSRFVESASVDVPRDDILEHLNTSGCIAIYATRAAEGSIKITAAPDPWREGPVLALAWAYSDEKAEGIADRLRRDLALHGDPDAFLAAFERLAVMAGARLHRVVMAEAASQSAAPPRAARLRNGAAALAVEQLRQTGALKPLNKEFRRRRLAGEPLPSFSEFVAMRLAESAGT